MFIYVYVCRISSISVHAERTSSFTTRQIVEGCCVGVKDVLASWSTTAAAAEQGPQCRRGARPTCSVGLRGTGLCSVGFEAWVCCRRVLETLVFQDVCKTMMVLGRHKFSSGALLHVLRTSCCLISVVSARRRSQNAVQVQTAWLQSNPKPKTANSALHGQALAAVREGIDKEAPDSLKAIC